MATPAETPQKKLAGEERVVSAEKPATKKRREMSTSELAIYPRGCDITPDWAHGAMLLVPVTVEHLSEADIDGKVG